MFFPALTWVLLIVSALACAIGFKKYIWFLSVGYGLSAACLGLCMLVLMFVTGAAAGLGGAAVAAVAIQCVLLVVYGGRLAGFLLARELKNKEYKKTLDAQTSKPMPVPVMVVMWIMVAVLYVMMVSPVWYRIANAKLEITGSPVLAYIGAVISALGIVIEATADKQKSAAKAKNPHMVAMDGLFKYSRCPNYFGEITFWTGIFVSALNVMRGGQWIVAVIGYVSIVYIMINGAQRLERRQNKNYGDKKEYQDYVAKTPILVPFLPIYHLTKDEAKK
ncbi:MAG: DUF1295 domain-containing protein [Firmicutes bacterium]|nr:DUF1295 domain-containing protein [Bacillota bacterium]